MLPTNALAFVWSSGRAHADPPPACPSHPTELLIEGWCSMCDLQENGHLV